MVSVTTEGNTVNITCGPTSFDIIGSDPREFPELPEVDDGNGLLVAQDKMKAMISRGDLRRQRQREPAPSTLAHCSRWPGRS